MHPFPPHAHPCKSTSLNSTFIMCSIHNFYPGVVGSFTDLFLTAVYAISRSS
jgi:hypothetical protein